MDRIEKLEVYYKDRLVGVMALYDRRFAAFEYTDEWIANGFSISPFSLPLEKKVFIPKIDPFDGIFGVFNDSLPDGFGRLLVDRLMRSKGINPEILGNMDRLSIVGDSGMGALSYRPLWNIEEDNRVKTYDEIALECKRLLLEEEVENIDYLFAKAGSSGGARPKVLMKIDGEDWIIKFKSSYDKDDIGEQEYNYSLCAKDCGIIMEETRLLDSEKCSGYFAVKRFDRKNGGKDRIHMVSASGLLETSHRVPNLDYNTLMKLTLMLTEDMEECMKLFKLMCFNVFAHNRDDHSKNFSYLYLEHEKRWILSPAYDLTYSNSIGGEHATTVNGNGIDPGMNDIIAVAKNIGLNIKETKKVAKDIQEKVYASNL